MIPRVLIAAALAVAWLSGRHLTVWLGGCPVASVPALLPVLIALAAFAVAFAFVLWRMRNGEHRVWRMA